MTAKSKVHEYMVTELWTWIVIPGNNPYIYIPFPNEIAARTVASEIDRDVFAPETFIHHQLTDHMREQFRLPRPIFPQVPDLPGHASWQVVSAKTWADQSGDLGLTRTKIEIHEPGKGSRTLHLTAKRLEQALADTWPISA